MVLPSACVVTMVSGMTASACVASGGIAEAADSTVLELRREIQQLKAQVAELLPYKTKFEKIQATVQLDRQRQQQKQQQQQHQLQQQAAEKGHGA
jgi:molecular chaperone GrpE (heat shock protein)